MCTLATRVFQIKIFNFTHFTLCWTYILWGFIRYIGLLEDIPFNLVPALFKTLSRLYCSLSQTQRGAFWYSRTVSLLNRIPVSDWWWKFCHCLWLLYSTWEKVHTGVAKQNVKAKCDWKHVRKIEKTHRFCFETLFLEACAQKCYD